MENAKMVRVIPSDFIDNRIIVKPVTKDGVTLTFLTDTGGALLLTPEAARKVNAPITKEVIGDKEIRKVELPEFMEDKWIPPLITGDKRGTLIVYDGEREGIASFLKVMDGLLGQAWFGNRIWTFDYLKKEMLYHEKLDSKSLNNVHSTKLWFQKNEQGNPIYHFPRIQATVDGEVLDFLFDTGATLRLSENGYKELNDNGGKDRGTCFITENMFYKWKSRHPEWRIIEQAEEDTGFPIIEVPEVTIAGYIVGPVWFTYRYNSSFHQYMAQWMDKEVEGALGGSLFQYFKITADYQNEVAYFER